MQFLLLVKKCVVICCNAWFHFGCVQMTNKKLKEIGEQNWYCALCEKENK